MDNYKNGPEGIPRVKRMSDSTIDWVINAVDTSAVREIGEEGHRQLRNVCHAAAEEVLARIPAWPAAPASSAPSGEAVKGRTAAEWYVAYCEKSEKLKQADGAIARYAKLVDQLRSAHPAAAPDSAQQDEDEPPLPEPLCIDDHEARHSATQLRQYGDARAAHAAARMMRKLGDGPTLDESLLKKITDAYAARFPVPSGYACNEVVDEVVRLIEQAPQS